jgi:hypothetical protein
MTHIVSYECLCCCQRMRITHMRAIMQCVHHSVRVGQRAFATRMLGWAMISEDWLPPAMPVKQRFLVLRSAPLTFLSCVPARLSPVSVKIIVERNTSCHAKQTVVPSSILRLNMMLAGLSLGLMALLGVTKSGSR